MWYKIYSQPLKINKASMPSFVPRISMKVLFSAPPAISLSLWLSLLLPLELSLLMKLLFRLKGKLLFWLRPIHVVVDIINYSPFMLSHLKAQSCSRPFLLIKLIPEV